MEKGSLTVFSASEKHRKTEKCNVIKSAPWRTLARRFKSRAYKVPIAPHSSADEAKSVEV